MTAPPLSSLAKGSGLQPAVVRTIAGQEELESEDGSLVEGFLEGAIFMDGDFRILSIPLSAFSDLDMLHRWLEESLIFCGFESTLLPSFGPDKALHLPRSPTST